MNGVIRYVVLIAILLSIASAAYAEPENLIRNPSFENGDGALPDMWNKWYWDTSEDSTRFSIDSLFPRTGKRYVTITNNIKNDARLMQKVPVEENSIYKYSCWIRTENTGSNNMGANISIEGRLEASVDVKGTSSTWQQVELYIKTGSGINTLTLTLGLGGYGSINKGTAYFDDVELVKAAKIPPGARTAVIEKQSDSQGKEASQDVKYKRPFWLLILALFTATGTFMHYRHKKLTQPRIFDGEDESPGAEAEKVYPPDAQEKSNPENISESTRVNITDKKDLLIMGIMTFVYLVAALINLGGFNSPEKGWTPAASGEYATFDLGGEINIDRVSYYCGRGKGWSATGSYKLELFDLNGNRVYTATLQKDNVFIWKYISANVAANTMKITAETPGGELNEISIYEKGSGRPLENITILHSETGPGSTGTPSNLLDEQHKSAYAPSYLNGTYFDEIYHARTAYEHIHRIEPFESTHPPLGKLFISIGIMIFGMNPFGWRIVGTLVGAAMIPVMYMFGKKVFGKRFYAFCCGFLIMFDFMHFVQTRIATIDVYVTFFVILMFYYMYDYFMMKTYETSLKNALKPLFLSGLMFGLGAASKWIALYGGAGLALVFFISRIVEYAKYNTALKEKQARKLKWVKDFIPNLNKTFAACVLFFVIIPFVIYLLSYIPFMNVPGPGHEIENVFKLQEHMYNYHNNLEDTHSFSSKWYQWPVMTKPIWYYSGSNVPHGMHSTIVSLGNPAIWWTGIAAFFLSLAIALARKDKAMIVIFIAIASQYLPWMLVPRIAFIYHYFSIVPFIIICIVYIIKYVMDEIPYSKYTVYCYLALVALLFIMFYPVLSGMAVPLKYVELLKWGKGWYF